MKLHVLYVSFVVVAFPQLQKQEAAIREMEIDRMRVEQEEKRKTLGAETKQHQQRAQYQDQLARCIPVPVYTVSFFPFSPHHSQS